MTRPVLYPLARLLARAITGVYFRRVEIVGGENLPASGPVLLAANHPQSITDALILGLASKRVVHFVAHSGLFRNPLKRLIMEGGGAIPIHRPSDVADAGERNRESFRACVAVLERGGCIGIFPEGTSAQERRVQRFKTGTVRIALQAEIENDFGLGVAIVPVGLSFQSALHFRSRVLVTFGKPLRVRESREEYERDPEGTVVALTEKLQYKIRHQVVHVHREELERFVTQVERVYSAELLRREGLDIPGHSRFERQQTLAREIARATQAFHDERPELIAEIGTLLDDYQRYLNRLRLPDRIVRQESSSFRREATRMAALTVIGAPVALWGALWNYAPYKLTGVVAHALNRDRTKIHWMQLAVGTGLFLAFYAGWTLFAFDRFDGWGAVAFLATMPPAGLFARWFVAVFRRRRRHLRWAYLQSTRKLVVDRILDLRQEIIRRMDDALEEHLARGRESEGAG